MISLGDKIQRLRVWRGLTQTELASGLVTPSMISQIEGNKANPSTELLLSIIRKLGVSVETFLKDVYFDLGGKGMYRFALELMEHGQYGAALQFLKQLEERPSVADPTELLFQMAVCHKNTGKVQDAIDNLDHVLSSVLGGEDRGFTARVLYEIGDAYGLLGNFSLSNFYLQKADSLLRELPEADRILRADVKSRLGTSYSRLGRQEEAVRCIREAYELFHPDHPAKAAAMLMNLGIEYRDLGEYDEAKDCFEQALAVYGDLPVEKNSILAKLNYAVLLNLTGKHERALRLFEECLAEFKEHQFLDMLPAVYKEMAQNELNRENFEQAQEYAMRGMEGLQGDHWEFPNLKRTLAEALCRMGNPEEAIQHLEQSLSLYEKRGRIADLVKTLSLLSKCYQQLGDVDKAVSALEKSKVYLKNPLGLRVMST